MKNKYTFWLILLAVLSSNLAFSQTNPTNMVGAWQQKDTVGGKVVQFRNSSTSLGITKIVTPATLADSLKNYAQIQDGLISGGEATLGVGSVTIDTAVYRINKVNYTSLPRTFSGIANSPSGTQYYLVVYGKTNSTLDTISGARDTIAIIPSIPANTVKVNTILVGDGGVESSVPDLSGFALLSGENNFNGNQAINGSLTTNSVVFPAKTGTNAFVVANDFHGGYFVYDVTDSIYRFSIANNGNTSIGYNNIFDSGYKLGVNGDVNTTGAYRLNGNPYTIASLSNSGFLTSTDFNTFNSKQDSLTAVNFGQFMDLGLATKLTPNSSDFLLGRDFLTNEAVEIPFSTVQPSLGYTPYNPASYPVNLGGETLQSVTTRGNSTSNGIITLNSGGYESRVNGNSTMLAAYNSLGTVRSWQVDKSNNGFFIFQDAVSQYNFALLSSGNLALGYNGVEQSRKLAVNGTGFFNGSVQSTGFGAGIAPSANHYLTTAANTSTIGSWLWTPSSTDYTGTVSGTFYNNANELKFYDGTISGTNRLVKSSGNALFVGTGVRALTSNATGDIAATTPILPVDVTDSDVITAITGATYNKANTFTATITPAGGKTFYKGQFYKSSTYLYIATADNVSYRTSLYGAETGWASYVDNQYTVGSPLSITSGTTVTLTNNAATTITSNLPIGVTAFYNNSTSKITPAGIGDAYGISIRFKAKSSSASDYFDFGIDVGGSVGVIFKQTKAFLKGANTEMSFDINVNAYTLSTFVSNGGLIKITAGNGTMSVYDIIFDVFRTHKGIQ